MFKLDKNRFLFLSFNFIWLMDVRLGFLFIFFYKTIMIKIEKKINKINKIFLRAQKPKKQTIKNWFLNERKKKKNK